MSRTTPSQPHHPLALTLACSAALAALTPTPAHPQGTRFLRQPDVSATHIVFTHANDLWKIARDGGDAIRLTSSEGGRNRRRLQPRRPAGSPSPASMTATPTST